MGKHGNRLFGKTKTGACFYSGRDRLKQGKVKQLSRVVFFFFSLIDLMTSSEEREVGQSREKEGSSPTVGKQSNAIVACRGSEWSLIVRDSFERTMTNGLNK